MSPRYSANGSPARYVLSFDGHGAPFGPFAARVYGAMGKSGAGLTASPWVVADAGNTAVELTNGGWAKGWTGLWVAAKTIPGYTTDRATAVPRVWQNAK